MRIDDLAASVKSILATDCGSTTTKAILIEYREGEYRLVARGEAPTTVEAPFDDVTVGVTNAVRELEELTGRTLLSSDGRVMSRYQISRDTDGNQELLENDLPNDGGVDLYLSTSSAGGGLQMTVAGVVKAMSAESAERAALGAGAIIIDTIAVDDGRKDYQKVERIRQLRPDMILMSGGIDGGTVTHLVELAEMLVSADPQPRLGQGMQLPVIFAGNRDAYPPVEELLRDRVALRQVENLRPVLERENLQPAREAIHELFLEHVMQQAPGYAKLSQWVSSGIMSTPNAVGKMMQAAAEQRNINVLGVDIGGATTDVFSVFGDVFNRTVSANLGMSYSMCNVLTVAGAENIKRWLPFTISDADLRNQLRNKMIRPTTIPQRKMDLAIEQAVAREALRLAFEHHKSLARGLKGVQTRRTIGEALTLSGTGETLVQMMNLQLIVGSGGVLSHAPQREQAALMMMDAYQPEGVTVLTVDSIFMMPQLGVLSTLLPAAAAQVFERDCLIYLGTCIAPIGTGREGYLCLTISMEDKSYPVEFGKLVVIPLPLGSDVEVEIKPERDYDAGEGKGRSFRSKVTGGVCGLIVDARGRPLALPNDESKRADKIREWQQALNIEA